MAVGTATFNVLGRTSHAAGTAICINQPEKGAATRGELSLAFADSAEKLAMASSMQPDFDHSDVAARVCTYAALFDRAADEDGLNFGIGTHESGESVCTVAQHFLASLESVAH